MANRRTGRGAGLLAGRPALRVPAACLAAGAAFALCLPKPGLWPLAWAAPAVPLYFLRREGSVREGAWLAALFGFGYCAVSLHWIYLTCRFAGVALPIAALAWAALGALLAVSWALFGAAVRRFSGRLPDWLFPWVCAILWTAIESAGARWTPRVGVDLLAYTQWRVLPLIQIGSVLGPHALGFVLILWNAALAALLADRTPGGKLRLRAGRVRDLSVAGAAAVLCLLFGLTVLAGRDGRPADGSRVEILQPNIDQYAKWDYRYEDDIRDAFDGLLSESRDELPDLILWPESALPGWLDEQKNMVWISRWAARLRRPMLVGAVSRPGLRRHNSAVLLNEHGEPAGIYHKRELVPFGEYVPLRPLFEGWIGILARLGDFNAGRPRQRLLATPLGRLAVTICYEAVFPRWGRLDGSRGARVFVNLTNDGWYKDTWGPHQHFYTNMYRAVENRVTVLRAGNTGISGAIDPYGKVLARTGLEERRRLTVRLPREDAFPNGSFYSRNGDVLGALCILVAVPLVLIPRRKPRRSRAKRAGE